MSFTVARVPARLFRLSRSSDPTKFTEWRYLANSARGRWSDPESEYRVLYTADSEVGAYVEVLQDLRPRQLALDILKTIDDNGEFGDSIASVEAAARERLRQFYFTTLLTATEDLVVDLAAGASRTEIEARLADDLGGRPVKIGDFSGGDYDFTGKVSRLVFTAVTDEQRAYAGLAAASAEHARTICFTYYESGRETNELRGYLYGHTVRPALLEDAYVRAAIDHLLS